MRFIDFDRHYFTAERYDIKANSDVERTAVIEEISRRFKLNQTVNVPISKTKKPCEKDLCYKIDGPEYYPRRFKGGAGCKELFREVSTGVRKMGVFVAGSFGDF